MSIVIKTTSKGKHYHGHTIALPYLGTLAIPENGHLTVEDHDKAHGFVKALPRDWEYAEPTDNPDYEALRAQEEINKAGEALKEKSKDNQPIDNGNGQSIFEDLDDEEKAEFLAALPGLTVKALQGFCSPFPGGQWRGKKKEELVEYIKGKLTN